MERLDVSHVPPSAHRLILVIARPLLREGLDALFASRPDFRLAASTGKLDSLLAIVREIQPDLALLDLTLPDGEALLAAQVIQTRSPATRLVYLDDVFHETRLMAARKVRAMGYFSQADTFATLVAGLVRIAGGGTAFTPAAEPFLLPNGAATEVGDPPAGPDLERLTRREVEILVHLARGETVKQCALQLHISPNTVEHHKSRLMSKLGIHRSTDLVRYALRAKLLE